jgi:hypothetical protein
VYDFDADRPANGGCEDVVGDHVGALEVLASDEDELRFGLRMSKTSEIELAVALLRPPERSPVRLVDSKSLAHRSGRPAELVADLFVTTGAPQGIALAGDMASVGPIEMWKPLGWQVR